MTPYASAALVASPRLATTLPQIWHSGRPDRRTGSLCSRPNLEAVIQRGNDQELNNYMLAGRESGMTDFQTALKTVQSIVNPADYQLFGK